MGASLHVAARESAYILVDRGTWLAEGDKSRLTIITEGDPLLFNEYEAVLVTRQQGAAGQQEEAALSWSGCSRRKDRISSTPCV